MKKKNSLSLIFSITTVVVVCFVGIVFFQAAGRFYSSPQRDYMNFFGTIGGCIVLLCGLWIIRKRIKWSFKQQISAQTSDADKRIRGAALLADKNAQANLSGIRVLHQIAMDSFEEDQRKRYVRTVHNILCSYIRENGRFGKNDEGRIVYLKRTKPDVVFQTILDALFKNEKNIYKGLPSDLSRCNLENMDLSFARLEKVNLFKANLSKANLQGADLKDANLSKANLSEARLSDANLVKAYLSKANLKDAKLTGAKLYLTDFSDVVVSEDTCFRDTILERCEAGDIAKPFRSLRLTHPDRVKRYEKQRV